jgi:hypothetical protein
MKVTKAIPTGCDRVEIELCEDPGPIRLAVRGKGVVMDADEARSVARALSEAANA